MRILLSIAILLGPIVLWGVYKLSKMHRAALEAERDALPFAPKPEPAQNTFLGRIPLPERTLLREQLRNASILYFVLSWLFVNFFSIPLWPPTPWKHGAWTDPSAYAWFQYLRTASGSSQFCMAFCLGSALMVITPLKQAQKAQFYRTRPVGLGFQFWSHVLSTLSVLLASAVTGMAISLALLSAAKGPVWQHLPAAFPGIVTGPDDKRPQLYQALLSTSAPRLFLSIVTTITLFFSATLALIAFPVIHRDSKSGTAARLLTLLAALFGLMAFNLFDTLDVAHWPQQLNFYTHLGAPPAQVFVAVAILVSGGLLLLARFFVGRREV
jgi:hypothetical protein